MLKLRRNEKLAAWQFAINRHASLQGTKERGTKVRGTKTTKIAFTGIALLGALHGAAQAQDPIVATGASVDESNITQVKYVANVATNGNGSSASPHNSIANALATIDWNQKARIILKAGTYRERVHLNQGSQTLVLQAEQNNTAVISGSDAWTGFSSVNGRWERQWPAPWTPGNHPWTPLDKNDSTWFWNQGRATDYEAARELVFINGQPLRQVMSLAAMTAGTFFNDRAAGKLYVIPAAGVSMSGTTAVEMGVRGNDPYASQPWNGSILRIARSNFVLRGVNVQHAINTNKQSAVYFSGNNLQNIKFENSRFLHNNSIGCDGGAANVTYKNCVANYNGGRGAGVLFSQNVLVEDSEFSYNGFRTGKILSGNDTAGFKIFGVNSERQTYRRCKFNYNTDTIGFWQDTAWRDVLVDHCIMEGNGYDGAQFELMPGSQLVVDCVIRNNTRFGAMNFGSAALELRRCFIYGNGQQIGVGIDTRVYEQDNVTPMHLNNVKVMNSTIVSGGGGMWTMLQFHARDVRANTMFANKVISNYNAWGDTDDTRGFFDTVDRNWPDNPDTPHLTLAQWRAKRNQDLNSTWNQYNLSNVPDPITFSGPLPAGVQTNSNDGPNLISNPSFDAEAFNTQTPSGWSEWGGPQGNHADASFTETAQGSRTGARHGTHWKGTAYEVGTDQFKTGLQNGLYTLRAWVRGSHGTSPAQMQAWGFSNPSTTRFVNIPNTSTWTLLEIKDINVTNNACNITFWSRAQANEWIHFEDVEFFKQGSGSTTLVNRATGGTVTARGENGAAESKEKAFDGSSSTKWLDFSSTSWIAYQFGGGATHAVSKYTITSANDSPERDPRNWTLQGWNGSSWVNLDTRSNETFASRFQKKEYSFTNSTSYNAYRLNITGVNGGPITQLAEIELFAP